MPIRARPALDAWAAVVADGRGDVPLLGRVLVRLSEGGWLWLNRVADGLREVSRVSPLRAWTAAELLQNCLPRMRHCRGTHTTSFSFCGSCSCSSDWKHARELKAKLASQSGSDKTTKLARRLAALGEKQQQSDRAAVAAEMLDARLGSGQRSSNGLLDLRPRAGRRAHGEPPVVREARACLPRPRLVRRRRVARP